MPVELQMLAWSIVLGLVYVVIGAALTTQQRGLKWNTSNRDAPTPPLSGAAARADRALRNFLETFAFLAAAVLAVVITQRTSTTTALGMQLYFWARVIYLPVYVIGIPYVRTLIWTVSVVGIVMVVGGLFATH